MAAFYKIFPDKNTINQKQSPPSNQLLKTQVTLSSYIKIKQKMLPVSKKKHRAIFSDKYFPTFVNKQPSTFIIQNPQIYSPSNQKKQKHPFVNQFTSQSSYIKNKFYPLTSKKQVYISIKNSQGSIISKDRAHFFKKQRNNSFRQKQSSFRQKNNITLFEQIRSLNKLQRLNTIDLQTVRYADIQKIQKINKNFKQIRKEKQQAKRRLKHKNQIEGCELSKKLIRLQTIGNYIDLHSFDQQQVQKTIKYDLLQTKSYDFKSKSLHRKKHFISTKNKKLNTIEPYQLEPDNLQLQKDLILIKRENKQDWQISNLKNPFSAIQSNAFKLKVNYNKINLPPLSKNELYTPWQAQQVYQSRYDSQIMNAGLKQF